MHFSYISIVRMSSTFFALLFLSLFIVQAANAATGLSATQTVANYAITANDQAANSSTTQTAANQTKAVRILSVNSIPNHNESITIGSCVINFFITMGSTTDEYNCNNNNATLDLNTGAGNATRTVNQLITAIDNVSEISGGAHGTLISSIATSTLVFQTQNDETSSTTIAFTDGTGGNITSTSSTAGVVGRVQINVLTLSGTVEAKDRYRAILPTVGTTTYVVQPSDTTLANVARGLALAVRNSSGYSSQAFTAASSSNTVVFTGKVAGTSFTQTSSAQNGTSTAQVVKFTPSDVATSYLFRVTINGTNFDYTSTNADLQTIVEGIDAAITASSTVSCTEDNVEVTCTAVTPGTAFTYSSSATEIVVSSGGGGGGGGNSSSGSSSRDDDEEETTTTTPAAETTAPTIPSSTLQSIKVQIEDIIEAAAALGVTVPQALIDFMNAIPSSSTGTTTAMVVRDLELGDTGADVVKLQEILISQNKGPQALALAQVGATGTFGPLTQAALIELQISLAISPAVGYFGPTTRAVMKAKGIPGIWW
jgi:hypothetical protein